MIPSAPLITRFSFLLLFCLFTFFNVKKIVAQGVDTDTHSNYISLNSYKGSTTEHAFTFRIHVRGLNVNYPNWSLLVRANQPIMNSEGKVFDPSKISIRINSINGGPTLQSIGTNNAPIPLSLVNQAIFTKSRYPIQNSGTEQYNQYIFTFDIIIAGGSYLEALKTWSQYRLNLLFTILRANDQILAQSSDVVEMQIYPQDTPPSEPTYGIQVNGNAREGLLEFKTISDYANGVSQTYQNGLSVISNTAYVVQVKSQTANFEASNASIPVNTVSLNIKDPSSALGGTINLSQATQNVFTGLSTGNKNRFFDIRYFTQPNDQRLLNTKPDTYRAILMYTLIPQ